MHACFQPLKYQNIKDINLNIFDFWIDKTFKDITLDFEKYFSQFSDISQTKNIAWLIYDEKKNVLQL